MRLSVLFPLFVAGALSVGPPARAEDDSPANAAPYAPWPGTRVHPPRPVADAGPAPHSRAPDHARRPLEIVSEFGLSMPICQDGAGTTPCTGLGALFGGALSLLYRPNPYFAFGAGASYRRATDELAGARSVEATALGAQAVGRVYLYEEGAFDPYLELELGYGSLSTSFTTKNAERVELSAFGPSTRVGGGVDFVALPALKLGAAAGFSHLLLERGETCASDGCRSGNAPPGSMLGGLLFALRASLLFGDAL